MKFVIESVASSTMIYFKLSHNSKPAQTFLQRRLTLDEVKLLLCLAQSLKGSNMSCCLQSSSEPSQLCLGPEFCRLHHKKSKDKTSTLNMSQCSLAPNLQQQPAELSERYKLREDLLESTQA